MKKIRYLGKEMPVFLVDGRQFDFVNGEMKEVPDNFKERILKQVDELEFDGEKKAKSHRDVDTAKKVKKKTKKYTKKTKKKR